MLNQTVTPKELRQTRKIKDKDDIEKIKAVIKTTLNLFDKAVNENALFNIRTGRVLQRNGQEYLLTIKDEGEKRRDAFIKECTERPSRFEEPIKKVKILNILKKNKSKQVADEITNIKSYVWKRYVWKVIIFVRNQKY